MIELTLADHIVASAVDHDGCPVSYVTDEGEHETTLGALASDAARVAGALQARGIGAGDTIAEEFPQGNRHCHDALLSGLLE